MRAHSIKTDNANISHKVYLRKQATKDLKELRVLDCYAGENRIWKNFDCKKDYGIEKVKGKGTNLNADNQRVLASLDLSEFNVIDFDSYGVPAAVICLMFQNQTLQKGTVVLYTCIGNSMSALPKELIMRFNLSKLYKKCKVLFNKKSHDLFYSMLFDFGVDRVWEYSEESSSFEKTYGYFIV